MSAIPLIIIIAREFMVSGLRLVTANEGVVVAAGIWGKLKTAFTMVAIVAILLFCCLDMTDRLRIVSDILIWVSTALTIISGAVYLKGYWKYIDTDK
jgi:CDP-diacylglycerol--glycerol-3-phosphate 3-phosphatidyltransferase